jgi:Trypsin-like peptidase domain
VITTNILLRTFHVKYGQGTGTCFTIDIDSKQYLITAKHVVAHFPHTGVIDLYHDGHWRKVTAKLVGHADEHIDITVLSLDFQISPSYLLPASDGGICFGQNVYFLGFPYGLSSEVGELNRNFPMPFVKGAILSSIVNENGVSCLFLDGNNNPGFSGGPVVFTHPESKDLRVAAVISGYRFDMQPVYWQQQPTDLAYQQNTGIILTYSIRHAVDLIKKNPIGFPLTDSSPA